MSLIVEQTLPYSSSQLHLEDSKRWSRLFPLIRPSIKTIEAVHGQVVVVDTALAASKNVLIAAVGRVGNFSSKILSESHLAAFTTEQNGKPAMSGEEIFKVLKDASFPVENGVVVLRTASREDLTRSERVAKLSLSGELKLDHMLSLLLATKPEIKQDFETTYRLLEHFVKSARQTTSKFHQHKSGNGPSVQHEAEMAEFTSAKSAIDKDLSHLLSSVAAASDDAVYSVHYSDINGLSRLENNILAHEISEYFVKKNLKTYITQSTILESESPSRGWAISLCALPSIFLMPQSKPSNALASANSSVSAIKPRTGSSKIALSDSQVRKIITAGCERVIREEPTITEYDTIVGDGDCGYTLRDGAKQVLAFISTPSADLANLAPTLSALVGDLEVNMGGTSGALYCIFLSSLSQELWEADTFPLALKGALDHLLKYTRARLGDRTCLDCLIPFVETLVRVGDSRTALTEAEKGVEGTKKLEAKLGRSSYLDENVTRGVPDPGAYGLLMLLEGMVGVV